VFDVADTIFVMARLARVYRWSSAAAYLTAMVMNWLALPV